MRDLASTIAVLVVVVLVGLGAWALTRSTASTIDNSGGSVDIGADQGAGPAPTAPTTSTSPTTGSSPSSPPSGTTTATGSQTGAVDTSIPVVVLNSTRTSGLAASVAATLRSAGWTVPTTDNYRRTSPPTTVYYGTASQRATAEAVAADVGGSPRVRQTSEFGTGRITVVIGSDYDG